MMKTRSRRFYMDARPLEFVVTACAGELLSGSPKDPVRRVCTDSRQAKAGDLFVALSGDRFDGHQFLPEVAKKGVVAAVVARNRANPNDTPGCALIAVEDTRQALGKLAARYRKDFSVPVVAVAGSNGKTTTKELIAAVLRQKLATLWSEASFNNNVGVPLTLLKLEAKLQAAVLEVGTNHPGELAPLVEMIQPRYGVLTGIGREHLEFFGDLNGVAREEGFLAELLPSEGKFFINGDNEWSGRVAKRTRATVVRSGFSDGNDWKIRSVQIDKDGVAFRVEAPMIAYSGEYRVNLLGRHQVANALFAIAVGAELGVEREAIGRGLAECRPAKMRMERWENNGVQVLDDAYNANADSMMAALQTLQEFPCAGRRIAVLGDMAELGAHSEAAHQEIGRRAAELGIGQLFAVGKMAAVIARGAKEAGLTRVIEIPDVETAASAIKSFVKPGDVVLLKASRATRLERVGDQLRAVNT